LGGGQDISICYLFRMSVSTIIGFNCGVHDASVSLLQNNEVKAVYTEERFSCFKQRGDTITQPLTQLLKDFDIDLNNVDMFATTTSLVINETNDIYEHHRERVKFYPHHLCHAIGALLFSKFEDDTMVLTLDAGDFNIQALKFGDRLMDGDVDKTVKFHAKPWHDRYQNNCYCVFGSVSVYRNGTLRTIKEFNLNFGNLYLMGCHTMYAHGIRGTNIEGKLMGLSSQGKYNHDLYTLYRSLCRFDAATESFESLSQCAQPGFANGWLHHKIINLGLQHDVRDCAYNLQKALQDGVSELVQFYKNKLNTRRICLSGGIFANVKVNQLINENFGFDEIFVMPAMSDEGISLGAALTAYYTPNGITDAYTVHPIKVPDHVYLGKGYTDEEIDSFIKSQCKQYQPFDHSVLTKELQSGKIVGVFRGRSEYGPRALGNRSILVDPSNRDTFSVLNHRLQRNEIMPFAPAILSERVDEILHCTHSKRSAQFMTTCYNVRSEWINKIPAVINVYDNTCRPQIVTSSSNVWLHTVLNNYNDATGIPVLLNTSFNTHGYPIINEPSQAYDALRNNVVDIVVIGDYIVYA